MNLYKKYTLTAVIALGLLLAACTPDTAGSETVAETPDIPVEITETPQPNPTDTAEPTETPEPAANPADQLLGTSWQLVGFGPDGNPLPDELDVMITLSIGDGVINGNGGCNSYFGDASFTEDSLSVPLVGSTEMACFPENIMNFEMMYFEGLRMVNSWKLDGDMLTLSGPEMQLIFIREQPEVDATLENTIWIFNGLGSGSGDTGAVSSPISGTEANMQLVEGQIAGSAGCNNFNGSYTLENESVTLSPLASTRMACEDAISQQEFAILNGLMAATSWEIEGDNLTVTFPDGFLLFKAQS